MARRPRPALRVPASVKVLLAVDRLAYWGQDVMLGIAQFARTRVGWELLVADQPGPSAWDSLGSFRRYDAVITTRPNDPRAARLHRRGVPLVAAAIPGPRELPTVLCDDLRVGRMAGEYFAGLGYQTLAFLGNPQPYSRLRRQGLADWAADRRLPPPTELTLDRLTTATARTLQRWIAGLPKPAAILGCDDGHAALALRACRSLQIPSPGDVSVLGVNNAVFDCEMTTPPLSSIDHNLRGVGHAAAEALARLLDGEPPPARPRLIPPIGVVERGSTGVRATPDRDVARALDYIRENAAYGIGVADVLEQVPMSRATLDRAFKRWLGRTAHDEIRRRQIDRARELLAQTDLDMLEVAVRSGFNYRQQFHAAFRAVTGLTPRAFRRRARRL